MKQGQGTYTYADGTQFLGEFKEGVLKGRVDWFMVEIYV